MSATLLPLEVLVRRSVLSAALAAALSFVACSDQPTEPRPPDVAPTLSETPLGCTPAPTAASLLTQINDLLPRSLLRTSLIAMVNALPGPYEERIKTAVRNRIFLIQDLILRAYYAGKLKDGTSTATFDKVLRLIEALHCYVGLTPPSFPSTTSGSDVVAGVLSSNSPTTTFVTPSKHGASTIPAGAVSIPTLFVITLLPDAPPPLRTTLDQYPLFYHFSATSATGPATFNEDVAVTAGVCLRDEIDVPPANLRLAHNVGPNFGDVEVLPKVTQEGLDCTDLGGTPSPGLLRRSSMRSGSGVEADNRWGSLRRVMEPVARAFLPEPLHAASTALTTLGVGGTTKKFSEFGVVDVSSNPGAFGPVGPTSSTVDGPRTVYVKATSRNGGPIRNVPVDFDGAEMLTNDKGIASFNWVDATPGASLTPAVPNERDEEEGCVSAIPEHLPDDPYRPFVCFTPHEVTFTTNTLLDYGSGGYRFILIGSTAPSATTPNYPGGLWFSQSFSPGVAWSTGPAPFGYLAAGCSIYTSHPVATPWAAADGSGADPSTGSGLLLRKEFKTPTGFNGSILVNVAIDNDIQVYVDGHNVTNAEGVTFTGRSNTDVVNGYWFGYVAPFQAHGGCAQQDDGTFRVPSSHLDSGNQHLLAVYARDQGGASYVDVQITLEVSD